MEISEYLYVPLITWALAQSVKFLMAMIRGQYRPSLLFSSGGMPSVHSATVASLATVALIEGGPAGPLFGITGIFAAIVMYDSLGVRRSAGDQARTLNVLIDDLQKSGTLKKTGSYQHLREILGHRPLEVVVGATMGVILSCIFLYQIVFQRVPWLLEVPSNTAEVVELVVAGILVVLGVGFWLSARKGKLSIFRPFLKQIMISNIAIAIALVFAFILQTQAVPTWNTWLIVVIIGLVFLCWHLGLWYHLLVDGGLRNAPTASVAETQRAKWLARKQSRASRRRKAKH